YVVEKILQILGATQDLEVHNHHNFCWKEQHFGRDWYVVRKGCTPAFPGQHGFIGSNMFDASVIVEGVDSILSQQALYSTVHGAGRMMSRRQALGRTKWTKGPGGSRQLVILKQGIVDFEQTKSRARSLGIELRG